MVALVGAFRRDLGRLLTDTCTITRRTGEALNTTTGGLAPSYTQQFSGACRVRSSSGREVEAGEESLALHLYKVTLPWDTDGIKPDDVVSVSSEDGDLDGATLIVEDVAASTFAGLRILTCRRRLE